MIIDTHLHLINRSLLSYPWLQEVDALNRDASYDEYQRTASRIGIVGALHMEVDVAESDRDAETDMVCRLMAEPDSLIRGAIAACRPESDDFAPWLDRQRERPEVKGLRRVLHVMPDELSRHPRFRNNIKRLSSTGLTFDLCVRATQLPLAMELADHCPDVTFILDHCGVPDIRAGQWEPWCTGLSALSTRENVVAKVSGVMAYADNYHWKLDDLRPYVEHTIDSFGWHRVVWGSDSPVCTLGGQIDTWVAATHAIIDGCSNHEKAQLLHANATRLWKLAQTTDKQN